MIFYIVLIFVFKIFNFVTLNMKVDMGCTNDAWIFYYLFTKIFRES